MDSAGETGPRAEFSSDLSQVERLQPTKWSRRRSRNYWSRIDPSEFGCFPEFKPLPYLKESHLIKAAQQGDVDALKQIWSHHMRLVLGVVNGYNIPRYLMADALQEGLIGIQRAIMKFEVERYLAFPTYAWYWIAQRIQRFLSMHRFGTRVPSHLYKDLCQYRRELHRCTRRGEWFDWWDRWNEADPRRARVLRRLQSLIDTEGMSQANSLDSEHPGPFHTILHNERRQIILEVLDHLDDRERWIIIRRYGLDNKPENTLEELGQCFKMTRERVRQVQLIAEANLRRHLKSYPELSESN